MSGLSSQDEKQTALTGTFFSTAYEQDFVRGNVELDLTTRSGWIHYTGAYDHGAKVQLATSDDPETQNVIFLAPSKYWGLATLTRWFGFGVTVKIEGRTFDSRERMIGFKGKYSMRSPMDEGRIIVGAQSPNTVVPAPVALIPEQFLNDARTELRESALKLLLGDDDMIIATHLKAHPVTGRDMVFVGVKVAVATALARNSRLNLPWISVYRA